MTVGVFDFVGVIEIVGVTEGVLELVAVRVIERVLDNDSVLEGDTHENITVRGSAEEEVPPFPS